MTFTKEYESASKSLTSMGAIVIRTYSDHVRVEVDGNGFDIWTTGAVTADGSAVNLNHDPRKLAENIRGIVG